MASDCGREAGGDFVNFRAVATEIMLHANEEKWYETRDRIEAALRSAQAAAEVQWLGHGYQVLNWRDQPDGVR